MKKLHSVKFKGGGKGASIPAPAPVAEIEEKEPDTLITGSKKKRQETTTPTTGLNRFQITPATGNSGSGATVPE